MVDLNSPPPFPECLRDGVGRALRGEPAAWPATLTPAEIDAVTAHGMLPMVYAWSRITALRGGAIAAAAQEAIRQHEMVAVLDALATRGVEPLILKGSALAYLFYNAPEQRPRSDSDLLIREEDRARIPAVFSANGYTEAVTSGDELAVRQVTWYRTDAYGIEHAFDVHWNVTNAAAFDDVIRYDEARATAVPVPELGTHARSLDRVRALLLACVHRVAHHHASERMIWLVDIHLLGRSLTPAQWTELWALSQERRVLQVVIRSIEAASAISGVQYVSCPEYEEGEPTALYLRRDATRGQILLNELRNRGNWRDRFVRLLQLAFPPYRYMKQQFGVRSRLLLPLAYLWRGMRGLGRLFRRVT